MDAPGNRSTERAQSGNSKNAGSTSTRVPARSGSFCAGGARQPQGRFKPSRANFSSARCSRWRIGHRERRHPLARYEHAPRHVVEARYLGDYKVWLEFNDGRKGVVDLADELYGNEFESLRDRDRFAAFVLDYGLATIAWENGVDFAPAYLYERLNAVH